MKKFYLLLFILLSACATNLKPPQAAPISHFISKHGEKLRDDYYWLKDKTRQNPLVLQYLQQENQYSKKALAKSSQLRQEIFAEMKARIVKNDLTVPVKRDSFYYYSRYKKNKQYPILCRKKHNMQAAEEIVLDLNITAADHKFFSLGSYQVSPNHQMLAYSFDTSGNERYQLRILNLKSREVVESSPVEISTVCWANDNKTLFYATEDESGRTDKIWRHQLGNKYSTDNLVYQENDPSFYAWIYRSKNKKYLVISSSSKTSSEQYLIPADKPLQTAKIIRKREPQVKYSVSTHEDGLFIRTNKDDAFNYKIMKASYEAPANWHEFLAHRDSVYIYFDIFQDHLVVSEKKNGLNQFRIINLADSSEHIIEFDEDVYLAAASYNPNYNSHKFRYYFESMIQPYTIYDYDLQTRTKELLKQKKLGTPYETSNYKSKRIYATAQDGTQIPISIVYKESLFQAKKPQPLLLYAYGSYGDSSNPYFSSSRLSLLDRGVIFAIAHVRGGGELGKRWHQQGRMLQKKNTFTDFISCAQKLISENYTASDKLIIEGGSAGGMLVGAVLNMKPELFMAAIADVPFVDVLNTMLDPSLSAVVSEYEEWGNPNIKEQFDYIHSYCPYQNVSKQPYPHVLALAGFWDTRVNYWEPAKWVAKLRKNNTANSKILLKVNMNAGHMGASARYDYLQEIALKYSFIFQMLRTGDK
jgi:oligopeptidase B